MPRPPVNPEGFDKVNYVIDSWVVACDAPWYIYIETLKPAALEAFIVLISFGWADVIRGAFRPKGLGRRTSKRKGKWRKRVPAFPEIGNTIGKHLPFAEQIEDFVEWGHKGKFLWRLDNALQVGLFYWLVADVAEDFIFNWTSLLYETEWCKQSGNGRFSWHKSTDESKSAGSWHKQNYPVEDYQYPLPQWLFDAGATGSYACTVVATVTFTKLPAFPTPNDCKVKIWNPLTGWIWAESDPADVDPTGVLKIVLKGDVPAHSAFEVRTWHEPSWCLVGKGVVVALALGPI